MIDIFRNKKTIKLVSVDLGVRKIKVPVCEIQGKTQGVALLITAGADGDEYASIDAAYKLIEEFKDGNFTGKLIIIPVLNIPGFEKITSINPLDGKYPKNIYPGKEKGTSSEKLIYWLNSNYIRDDSVWLDMHGGALNEKLDPYIYFYETENVMLNKLIETIIYTIDAPKVVFEKPKARIKTHLLSKKEIVYILSEAGYLGNRNIKFIEKHVSWAKTIMSVLNMIKFVPVKKISNKRIYRNLYNYKAKFDGCWYPFIPSERIINQRQKIGEIKSLDGLLKQEIFSDVKGECLWWKEGIFCKKGETVVEIGY